jgi:subtilisin family serine protease
VPSIGAGLLTGSVLAGLLFGLTPAAVAVTADGTSPAGTSTGDTGGTAADGRYIVTFSSEATADDVSAARRQAVADGAQILYDYNTAMVGFAALLPESARTNLVADPTVHSVEPDEVVQVDTTQSDVTAGLDRIDQRTRKLNDRFHYSSTGAGVTVYVIDTGVYAGHSQFGGRVEPGKSFTGPAADTDCGEGHGTHVAGLIAGATYGVAKAATIVPVKVFSCDGSASVSTVIAGIEWATEDAKLRGGPTVINLSAGVDKDMGAGLDRAAANAIRAGVPFVTAAGNDSASACSQSPARVSAAITVGAVSATDRMASFSNHGTCVDIFAPGLNVRSAGIASPTASAVKDGTSMSAPYVTGVIAAYLQRDPTASPAKVRTALLRAATSGVLRGIGSSSPNKLLYNGLKVVNHAPHVSVPAVSLPGRGNTIGTSTVPVTVSWKGSDSDGSVRSYLLERSVDGGRHWNVVSLASPTATSVSLALHPSSRLRFRVRATDNLGRRSSWATRPTMRLILDEQGAARLHPTWARTGGADLTGGASRGTGVHGASATYHFTGSSIRLIGTTDTDHGKAVLYLDGHRLGTIDTYSATRRTCVVLYATSVRPGRHILRVVVTGSHSGSATGNRVDVDGFVVTR